MFLTIKVPSNKCSTPPGIVHFAHGIWTTNIWNRDLCLYISSTYTKATNYWQLWRLIVTYFNVQHQITVIYQFYMFQYLKILICLIRRSEDILANWLIYLCYNSLRMTYQCQNVQEVACVINGVSRNAFVDDILIINTRVLITKRLIIQFLVAT